MKRGQAALEFLFLILIIIIYITTITIPLVQSAQNIVFDTESVSRANNETQKIINTIRDVGFLGIGSRETINIFIPNNTVIQCTDKNISFKTQIIEQPWPTQCPSGFCTKTITLNAQDINCTPKILVGPTKTQLLIEKTSTAIQIIQVG